MFLTRLATFGRRYLAARRLGVPFFRAASFETPRTVRLGTVNVPVHLPTEHGVRMAFVELLLDDCYGLRVLANGARGGTINHVLDIGANVGLFGLAARVRFPQASIHCYEPNAALEPYLSHQARIARCDYFLESVGREAGRVRLNVDPAESVLSTSHADPVGSIPQVALRTALDRLGGDVDLVKMDCEGAEWELLDDRESWQKVRFLTLEYHLGNGTDHDRIGIVLAKLGYAIRHQNRASNFGLVQAERHPMLQ